MFAVGGVLDPQPWPGPGTIPPGEVIIGTDARPGAEPTPIGLSLKQLSQTGGMLVGGTSGRGKTYAVLLMMVGLARNGVPFLFMDKEGQGAWLMEHLGWENVGLLPCTHVPLDVFRLPLVSGATPQPELQRIVGEYLLRLGMCFRRLFINMGGYLEGLRLLVSLMHSNGVFHGSGKWPTWGQFLYSIDGALAASKKNPRVTGYLDALRSRVGGLYEALPGLHYTGADVVSYLLERKKCLIVNTGSVSADVWTAATDLMLTRIAYALEQDYHEHDAEERPRLAVVVEEAGPLLQAADPSAGTVLDSHYSTARKRKYLVVSVTQGLDVSRTVLHNAGIRLFFALPGARERAEIAGILNLDAEKDKSLTSLEKRQAVLSTVDWGAEPALVRIGEFRHGAYPDNKQILHHVSATLSELGIDSAKVYAHYARPPAIAVSEKVLQDDPAKQAAPADQVAGASGAAAKNAAPRTSPDALKVLEHIAGKPADVSGRARDLSMAPAQEAAARKELLDMDAIEECPEKLGKGIRFYTVREGTGTAICREHKIRVAKHRGGPVHAYVVHSVVERICSVLGWECVGFEKQVSNVFVDALLKGSGLVAFQANHACNVQYEVQNLMEVLASPDLAGGRALLVSTTQKNVRKFTKAVTKLVGSIPARAILIDFKEFMQADLAKLFEEKP